MSATRKKSLQKINLMKENLQNIPHFIIPEEDKNEFLARLENLKSKIEDSCENPSPNLETSIENDVDELNAIFIKLANKEFLFGINLAIKMLTNINHRIKDSETRDFDNLSQNFGLIIEEIKKVNNFLTQLNALSLTIKTVADDLIFKNLVSENPSSANHTKKEHSFRKKASHFCHKLFSRIKHHDAPDEQRLNEQRTFRLN